MENSDNKNKVTITVIDSGVDTTVSDLSRFVCETNMIGINEDGFLQVINSPAVHHIHGTVVSLVIRDLCPDVRIRSINILDKNLRSDGRILLFAMEYALIDPPDILHLSLGTNSFLYWLSLRSLQKKANKSGTVIVAASDNSGKLSFPASLKGVVGVKADPGLFDKSDFYYKSKFFYAPCEIDDVNGKNDINTRIGGNSTAAAFISGHIAKLLYSNYSQKAMDPVKLLIDQGIKNFKPIKEFL